MGVTVNEGTEIANFKGVDSCECCNTYGVS